MTSWRLRSVALLLSGLLAGCANLDAVRAFAKDGSMVAATARKDVELLGTACAELRAEATVLAYAGGAASAPAGTGSACRHAVDATQAAASSLAVQLLVRYHEALNALAGNEHWTLAPEVEGLGAAAGKLQVDGQALVGAAELKRFQGAFQAIADGLTAALRERELRRLLRQPQDWAEVLRPLRFWYGGADGRTVSLYSQACRIVRTEWTLVQGELMDYTRCDRRAAGRTPPCEPLTAAARIAAIDARLPPLAACAPGADGSFPAAAAARVKLIDDWLAAHEDLRQQAFGRDAASLRARLAALREQVATIRKAFD